MEYVIGAVIGAFIVFYLIGKYKDDEEPRSIITVQVTHGGAENDEYKKYDYSPPPVEKYWPKIERVKIKATLRIVYINAKKETSKRTIQIQEYDGSPYLRGFCELRNEQRTFRIDRIQETINSETGEIINNIPDYLLLKYHESSEYILLKIFSDYLDVIKVFFYIGKADGQLRAAERHIIYAAIRSLAKGKNFTDEEIGRHLNQLAVPSLYAFKFAFGRLCKAHPKQMPNIYAIAKKIVDTQKTIHPSEAAALAYMTKKMQILSNSAQ